MRKTKLDPRILKKLVEITKGEMTEASIRVALSELRREHPSWTLNATAQVFARKRNSSVARWLKPEDRDTLKNVKVEKIKIRSTKSRRKTTLKQIANYETTDKFLKKHLDEINKAYTYGCYTATFILCRKVLENLIVHHILKKKYTQNTLQHKEKYFDIHNGRNLDFNRLLHNLRSSLNDFHPEKKLVMRICQRQKDSKRTLMR